jgi:hypothetical protein
MRSGTGDGVVRVGVLGAATWAQAAQLPGYRRDPRCRVVAIADPNLSLARDAAQRFEIPMATDDHLIGRDDIDVIDVRASRIASSPSNARHLNESWFASSQERHTSTSPDKTFRIPTTHWNGCR